VLRSALQTSGRSGIGILSAVSSRGRDRALVHDARRRDWNRRVFARGVAAIVEPHVWVPRTRSEADPSVVERRPHWVVPLTGYPQLERPIAGEDVETLHEEIVELESRLRERYRHFKYYPFQDYRPNEIRATQAYLTKMPLELLLLLNRLGRFRFKVEYKAYRPAPR
jgi:hypothetical protein